MTEAEARAAVTEILGDEKGVSWWELRNPSLGMLIPNDLIASERTSALYHFIEEALISHRLFKNRLSG
jgi:hypothetical protein